MCSSKHQKRTWSRTCALQRSAHANARHLSMSLFGSGCEATKSQHFGVVVFFSCEFPKVATSHQGLATRSGLENGVMSCTVEKPNTNETFSLHHLQISFGGIPNSRNVLFLQIFLKRSQALQIPQLGLHPSLTDLLRNLLRNPVEPDLALHQSLPDLHLFRNPVEPDLALHHSPRPSPEKPLHPQHSPEHSPEPC